MEPQFLRNLRHRHSLFQLTVYKREISVHTSRSPGFIFLMVLPSFLFSTGTVPDTDSRIQQSTVVPSFSAHLRISNSWLEPDWASVLTRTYANSLISSRF